MKGETVVDEVLIGMYEGGPKRNRKSSLVGGPIEVHASAAR